MMPILYENDELTFEGNGICRLSDCISCVVTEERNGVYECDFEYPVSGAYYDEILPGRIIACTHDDSDDIQPFDIIGYSRAINGVVAFHAVHISYRLKQKVIYNKAEIAQLTGLHSVLAYLSTGSYPSDTDMSFTLTTDKEDSTSHMSVLDGTPHTIRELMGGLEGSILDTYGGEWQFDKWTATLMEARGEEKDFIIRYGLNLSEYSEETDYADTCALVVPYWKKDETDGLTIVTGDCVDTGLTDYGGRRSCAPLDLTEKFESKPTKARLETAAQTYLNRQKPNLPSKNIAVNFVRLQDEDPGLSELLQCNLCDSVQILFPAYGLEETFKIVKIVYNVLKDRYDSMELGNLSTSLAEAVGAGSSDGSGSASASPIFQTVTYQYEYSSIAAGGTLNITGTNFGVSTPDGYTPVAVVDFRSGSTGVSVISASATRTGENPVMSLYNHSSAAHSHTAVITILYVKSSMVS